MPNVIQLSDHKTKVDINKELNRNFNLIKGYAQTFIDRAGPDPLLETFINVIEKRESLPDAYRNGCSIINNIDLVGRSGQGKMIIEQFLVPCHPIRIQSEALAVDLSFFKEEVLRHMSPRQFLKDYTQEAYYPLISGAFILDSPDYLYLGSPVSRGRVAFMGLQVSTMKALRVTFDMAHLRKLCQYVPKSN